MTDIELADLLRTSGEAAFRLIYERHWDKLYVIARKRLNDDTEAEEVVQDIFCNLWRKRERLVLVKGFDNYFSIAVKFEVINRLAKRAVADSYQKEAAKALSEIDDSTIELLDYLELQRQFDLTVSQLPEKCRIVFKLRHDQGYSHLQIAEELIFL
ncbi:sigma-70 family RNA polymerase sigma factor [Mucilaginibacter aquaedulcis]|uniref:sigma-70 family RNA polymerase sigma factor n=1 Tax=Mucilaginibacter aquaedulcis TaxID=1187081 RepID=UPI0025B3CED3|nr:sigma-70 family RNA polymerase sigma factor [Mucilaginibacter aquaedulcis]MDN3548829.1 sigma-70 family RNA polymerase sigma factor [Mucilaginibacter aquaedulcis]